MGKNNKRVLVEKSGERLPQYGIKKLSVGVVSVAVGAFLSFAGTTVHASEIGHVETVSVELGIHPETIETTYVETVETLNLETPELLVDEEVESNFDVSEEDNIELELSEIELDNEEIQIDIVNDDEKFLENINTSESELIPTSETEDSLLEELTISEEKIELELEDTEDIRDGEVDETDGNLTVESKSENAFTRETEEVNQEVNQEVQLSNLVDQTPPRIIDIYPESTDYTGWEPRTVTVVVEEDNLVNDITLSYRNKAGDLTGWANPQNEIKFNYSYNNDLIRNEFGQYVIELVNNEQPYGDFFEGLYELDFISITDNLGYGYQDDGIEVQSSFNYHEYSGLDIVEPELIDLQFDKSEYKAGETVTITVTAKDDRKINYIHLYLDNHGDIEQESIFFDSYNKQIIEIDKNIFRSIFTYTLPTNLFPSTYGLNSYSLDDTYVHGERDVYGPKISFDVTNDSIQKVVTDYEIEYTTDDWMVKLGSSGIKYILEDGRELIIQEALNGIELYDNEYINIPYDTVYVADEDMFKDDTWLVNQGQDGQQRIFYDKDGNVVDVVNIIDGYDRVIRVGVLELVNIPYDTVYQEDPWRPENTEMDYVIQPGQEGYLKKIYDLDGNHLRDEEGSLPVNEIILRGTMPLIEIPFDTIYTYWDHEVREGYNGSKYIYPDGTEWFESWPQDKIVKYEGEMVTIPFDTEFTFWEYDVRQGYNGEQFIHVDGRIEVINEPWNEVRLYENSVEVVPFQTEYQYTYNEYVGYEKVLNEGKDGTARIFYDESGEEIYHYYIDSPYTEVIEIGMLTDVIVEERDIDPNVTNYITLVDETSGYILDTLEFLGKNYYARFDDYIRQFNEDHDTKIETTSFISTNTNKIRKLVNGEYVDTYVHNFVTYISNKSDLDLRDIVYPLVPTNIKIDYHDQYPTKFPNSVVNIYDKDQLLLEVDFDSELAREGYGDDTLIARSLKLLENEKYHFVRAEMFNSLIPSKGKEVIGNVFNVFVKEQLKKELVEARYDIDYTNDYNEVRKGQHGTKFVYEDGTEQIVNAPVNEVKLIEQVINDKPTIEKITFNKEKYAIGEEIEVTVSGMSALDVHSMTLDFYDYTKLKMHMIRATLFDGTLTRDNGYYTAVLKMNTSDFYGNSNFEFSFGTIIDKHNNESNYSEGNYFPVSFQVTENKLLGIQSISYETIFTTNEDDVRVGELGSKVVYSDGTQVILEEPISEIVLYKRDLIELDFEKEYTVYAHEVRAGIKGSKFVYENGVEKLVEAPFSAVSLYDNQVEDIEFETIRTQNPGLAFGETQLIQEGIKGRKIVFYDSNGQSVDSLIISAPVSRIEQSATEQSTIELLPYETTYTTDATSLRKGQNGIKYIYSDGTEEVTQDSINAVVLYRYSDEIIKREEVTRENSELTKGSTRVVSEGTDGSKRVFYDESDAVIKEVILREATSRVTEIGSLLSNNEDNMLENDEPDKTITEDSQDDEHSNNVDNSNESETDNNGSENAVTDDDDSDSSIPNDNLEDDKSTDLDNSEGTDINAGEPVDVENAENENSNEEENEFHNDLISEESSSSKLQIVVASVLPNTGEQNSTYMLWLATASLLSGIGLVVRNLRKRKTEEQY